MVLDGKAVAKRVLAELRPRVKRVSEKLKRPPCLAFAICAPEAATQTYFERERKTCAEWGFITEEYRADPAGGEAALSALMAGLSAKKTVDAVLLGMPLSEGFDARRVLARLDPAKDVEGLTPVNQGLFYGSKSREELARTAPFVPCTALAILRLLLETGRPLAGAAAVVIGRSSIVGRPTAHLLSCHDATVTLAHSKTRDLGAVTSAADILVAAIGKPRFVTASMVKKGAVVVDAGTNVKAGRLCGDVDLAAVSRKAAWITPVPGGVGPVTVAELLNAVVVAAERKLGNAKES